MTGSRPAELGLTAWSSTTTMPDMSCVPGWMRDEAGRLVMLDKVRRV